jgi:hypothetical protein
MTRALLLVFALIGELAGQGEVASQGDNPWQFAHVLPRHATECRIALTDAILEKTLEEFHVAQSELDQKYPGVHWGQARSLSSPSSAAATVRSLVTRSLMATTKW